LKPAWSARKRGAFLFGASDVDGVTGWASASRVNRVLQPENDRYGVAGLRAFFGRCQGKEFASPGKSGSLLRRVRGHKHAKARWRSAVWDAEAKQKGIPLAKLIGGVREETQRSFDRNQRIARRIATAVQKELGRRLSAHQEKSNQGGP